MLGVRFMAFASHQWAVARRVVQLVHYSGLTCMLGNHKPFYYLFCVIPKRNITVPEKYLHDIYKGFDFPSSGSTFGHTAHPIQWTTQNSPSTLDVLSQSLACRATCSLLPTKLPSPVLEAKGQCPPSNSEGQQAVHV